MHVKYKLLDSGQGEKLEAFGSIVLARPCSQAIWQKQLPEQDWKSANASFHRKEQNTWVERIKLPVSWQCTVADLTFKINPTDFGHLGVFPEHQFVWNRVKEHLLSSQKPIEILNLFAYSGGATLAAAHAGARVCHVDASKGMVAWARENAELNKLTHLPIRWIVEDVLKFLKREIKRGHRYDGIILDPPSFGRGAQGEVFKIEQDLPELLDLCRQVLTPIPTFIILSCHTPSYTPTVLEHLLRQSMHLLKGSVSSGELCLPADAPILPVPCGTYAYWKNDAT